MQKPQRGSKKLENLIHPKEKHIFKGGETIPKVVSSSCTRPAHGAWCCGRAPRPGSVNAVYVAVKCIFIERLRRLSTSQLQGEGLRFADELDDIRNK